MESGKERTLSIIAWLLFSVYLLILVRIILFKDTQLYDLFAMIGNGQRRINIIPFVSTFEMMKDMGILHNIQNIVGNMALFFPMGVFIPLLTHKGFKQTAVIILGISVGIETAQFVLAVGISDIDDVILNTLGALVAWCVFQYIKKRIKSTLIFRGVIIGLIIAFGFVGCFAVLTTETRLFQIARKQVTVISPELIAGLDYGIIYVTGKYINYNAPVLIIEKTKFNQNQDTETTKMELDQNTRIILEHYESNMFFDIIISEKQTYSALSYEQFLSSSIAKNFNRANNVTVWSADGKHIDTILIFMP